MPVALAPDFALALAKPLIHHGILPVTATRSAVRSSQALSAHRNSFVTERQAVVHAAAHGSQRMRRTARTQRALARPTRAAARRSDAGVSSRCCRFGLPRTPSAANGLRSVGTPPLRWISNLPNRPTHFGWGRVSAHAARPTRPPRSPAIRSGTSCPASPVTRVNPPVGRARPA